MLKIYNSLTKKKQLFQSLHPFLVNMYVCGPTVYNHLHLGNTRPLIFFDIVKRYLQILGFEVRYAVNITDIDDKIIASASKTQISEHLLTQKYIQAFRELLNSLDLQPINFQPQATKYITSMIAYIQELLNKGFAYFTDQGIYFRISKISDYGKLKYQDLSQLKQNARKQLDPQKEHPGDFILWKKTTQGIQYESPWFLGRPGWHTECVAMIDQIFATVLDIHGGGTDLKFPHHENEIAQAQAHSGRPLANFFMHVARLDYQNQKMSKSLGNVVWCRDLLQQFNPSIIKLFLLNTHYRKPINFNYSLMEQFRIKYHKIITFFTKNYFYLKLHHGLSSLHQTTILNDFHQLMQDDFATHKVIDLIEQTIKKAYQSKEITLLSQYHNTLLLIFDILGIRIDFLQATLSDCQTYHLWQQARQNKDFAQADLLRQTLLDKGLI
ncbi:cysteine--tRNA ligase [Candidatus Phytoplasma meliae]|uniref:Cysteine--tRNA ligase n=1 Tax=Candidatus Phytoplasma meliae TaxID=1848402 RepID=A0ABS5CY94_9MOLU|nr:cysteine--tRNA ligase [Candidatus Phytoplasma meliae]MBP5835940.1 cysteine--tRNA ligase [Candidatus Phytoplasma meliae]